MDASTLLVSMLTNAESWRRPSPRSCVMKMHLAVVVKSPVDVLDELVPSRPSPHPASSEPSPRTDHGALLRRRHSGVLSSLSNRATGVCQALPTMIDVYSGAMQECASYLGSVDQEIVHQTL